MITQKKCALYTRTIIIFLCALSGLFIIVLMPKIAVLTMMPYKSTWMTFIGMIWIPCIYCFVILWQLSNKMERNMVFTTSVAQKLNIISSVIFWDVLLYFCGNIFLLFAGYSQWVLFVASGIVSILGLSFSLMFRILSTLTQNAAQLQDDVNHTI